MTSITIDICMHYWFIFLSRHLHHIPIHKVLLLQLISYHVQVIIKVFLLNFRGQFLDFFSHFLGFPSYVTKYND